MSGKFIVFEGIDGSGKSTQAELLKEYLESKGFKVWLTKEPTDGQTGQLLQRIQSGEFKEFFKDPKDFKRFMTYLYAADRTGHYQQIKEHLDNNEWVICDRYKYSTYAYNYSDFNLAYSVYMDFPDPDLPIFIDVPLEDALSRINSRGKEKEIFEKSKYLLGVINKYDGLLDTKSLKIVDGRGNVNKVFNRVKELVEYWFFEHD